jgi:hypothetical protein
MIKKRGRWITIWSEDELPGRIQKITYEPVPENDLPPGK